MTTDIVIKMLVLNQVEPPIMSLSGILLKLIQNIKKKILKMNCISDYQQHSSTDLTFYKIKVKKYHSRKIGCTKNPEDF